LDRDLIQEMGDLGLIAAEIPEAFGGSGVDSVTAGLIIEAISYADLNVGYVPLLTGLVGAILVEHAEPAIAHAVVSDACAGKTLLALALTEPGGGV
jgi:cyclohexanecarboxyl-CoA dehydrogenase